VVGANNPLISTYDFMRDVVGYDLAAFFKRNSKALRSEIDTVLKALLAPETKLTKSSLQSDGPGTEDSLRVGLAKIGLELHTRSYPWQLHKLR
jgi:hypothetical protein